MTKTTNYQLNQWAKTDRLMMDDFNADNAKIDAALAGMPKIAVGTYTGTGTYDVNNKNTLTFPFAPKLVLIAEKRAEWPRSYAIAVYGQERFCHLAAQGNVGNYNACEWTGNTLTWYCTKDAMAQMNYGNLEYVYFAVG